MIGIEAFVAALILLLFGHWLLPAHFPAFEEITIDGRGRIFVQTYQRGDDGLSNLYDVFDEKGRFIARLSLRCAPKCGKGGKFYAVEMDAEGNQFIKRFRVSWKK